MAATAAAAAAALLLAIGGCESGGELPETGQTVDADREVAPPEEVACEDLVDAPLSEELAADPVCQGDDDAVVTGWTTECEDGRYLAMLGDLDDGQEAWTFSGEEWRVVPEAASDPEYEAASESC
ncbi:MAG: hypothetical protein M3419_08530 [Actinomycetota bacterium]|nr:hypothetical protein [Actinomycetota bacterium]